MTIWWVDPYIGTTAGNANGTTDTTTRNGTYAAPFRLSDVTATSQTAPGYNGQTIAAGDEIRFKGLTTSQWRALTMTESWYRTGYSDYWIRSVNKSSSVPAAYIGSGATKKAIFWFDSVPGLGGGPMIAVPQYLSDQSTYWQIYSSSTWWQGYGYGVVGSNPINPGVYLLNADYFQPQSSGYTYFFYNAPQITVTAGWDSETTRDGKTFLVFLNNSSRYIYVGQHGTSMARVDYDCPEMYLISLAYNTSGWDTYWYFYAGTNAIFKFGGIAWMYGSSQPYLYVSPGSQIEMNGIWSTGYGWYVNNWSSACNGATVTLKNNMCSYSTGPSLNCSGSVTYKIGSVYSYQNSTIISLNGSQSGGTIELLANSVYYLPTNVGGMFNNASYLAPPYVTTLTYGSGITNTFSGAQRSTTSDQPSYRVSTSPTGTDAVNGSLSALTGSFYQVDAVTFSGPELDNIYRATKLDVASDYRNLNVTIPNTTSTSGEIYRGYHFATNGFDQRPVALIFSNSGKPALLYNEASKADALTFQGAPGSNGEYFNKQVAIDMPSYTGMTSLRLTVTYETSAGWNGEFTLSAYGINGTSGAVTTCTPINGTGSNLFTGAQATTQTWTVDIPYSWWFSNAITQFVAKLKFKSGSTNDKFYLRDITLTQVP